MSMSASSTGSKRPIVVPVQFFLDGVRVIRNRRRVSRDAAGQMRGRQ